MKLKWKNKKNLNLKEIYNNNNKQKINNKIKNFCQKNKKKMKNWNN